MNRRSLTFGYLALALVIALVVCDKSSQQQSENNHSKIEAPMVSNATREARSVSYSPDCPALCTCTEKKINCEGNELTTLQGFNKIVNVTEINLRNNSIRVIDLRQLPLQTLESLDLSFNKVDSVLTYKSIEKTSFKLKNLNLSTNQLRNLTSLSDLKLHNLEILDISFNPIEELGPSAFSNMKNLQTLEIQNTKLKSIEELAFSPLPQLRFLNMSSVKLTNHLGDKQFAKNRKLEIVDLSDNGLIEVPFALRGTSSIDRLILNRNSMTSLRHSDFLNRANLTYLEIKECPKLSKIDELTFSDLTSLKTLIIADNPKLQFISKDAFLTDDIHALELIDLRGNNLTTMVDIRESTAITFNQILLSDNPWQCSCDLKWITTLARRPTLHCAGPEQFKDLELSQFFLTTDCETEDSSCHKFIITGFLIFLLGIAVAVFVQKNEFCRRLLWKDQYGTIYYTKASFPTETV